MSLVMSGIQAILFSVDVSTKRKPNPLVSNKRETNLLHLVLPLSVAGPNMPGLGWQRQGDEPAGFTSLPGDGAAFPAFPCWSSQAVAFQPKRNC